MDTSVCCAYEVVMASYAGLAYRTGRSYGKAKESFLQAAECYAQRESYLPAVVCVFVCVCTCVTIGSASHVSLVAVRQCRGAHVLPQLFLNTTSGPSTLPSGWLAIVCSLTVVRTVLYLWC